LSTENFFAPEIALEQTDLFLLKETLEEVGDLLGDAVLPGGNSTSS